ncbi:hypothetical protein BDN72DRAFT_907527 [Pluteus cervinus]|uniref:Uncharacterized protein n=1 Tax=Pluteus cervinus TaxID=181527 RepID=A0ACD2ZW96_9AGAR|nr:hypothetical protein BDN72DRAFT_907527 [Pluteus cervinus]
MPSRQDEYDSSKYPSNTSTSNMVDALTNALMALSPSPSEERQGGNLFFSESTVNALNSNHSNADLSLNVPRLKTPTRSSSSDGQDLFMFGISDDRPFSFIPEDNQMFSSGWEDLSAFASHLDSAADTLVPPSPVNLLDSATATLVYPSLSTTPKCTSSGDLFTPTSIQYPENTSTPYSPASDNASPTMATYEPPTDEEMEDQQENGNKRKATTSLNLMLMKRRKMVQHTADGAGGHPPGPPAPHWTPRKGSCEKWCGT